MRKSDVRWHLITIVDRAALPGISIQKIFEIINQGIEFRYAVVDDIIGANTAALLDKENEIMTFGDLLKLLPDVVQFDWGNFFLFNNQPPAWRNEKNNLILM